MFARTSVLSLALSCAVNGLDLDVNSQDSIKSTAKTLAGGIMSAYKSAVNESGTPGLFGGDYYFWEAGIVFDGIIGYSYLTGDTQYDALVSEGMQFQLGDANNFMPVNQTKAIGNDDQSCWGLAAMTAAEIGFPKPKDGDWLDYAKNVFDNQALRFEAEEEAEDSCDGGLRWQIFSFNAGYDYKNMASQGNFFLLAARLAKFTGNQTYATWADKAFSWSQDVGLISEEYSVFDGTSVKQGCKEINLIQWSWYAGVVTEGAAIMYNITGAQNWTDSVTGLVNRSSVFQQDDILVEVACERNGKCDIDQRAMKGIAARSFARTAIYAPIVADSLSTMLEASAKAAATDCSGKDDPSCSLAWADPDSKWESAGAGDGNLGEVFNALEVVQSLLYPSAKGVKSANGTSAANSTENNGTAGAAPPESTGAAGTVAASLTTVFAVAFAAALSY